MASKVAVQGPTLPESAQQILTDDALEFLAFLQRQFTSGRKQLLQDRRDLDAEISSQSDWSPRFLEETRKIREADWQVASPAPGLEDRRVEITGPPDAKMMINALNSGAKVFMVDFEDSLSPTWDNVVQGHLNVTQAIRRTLSFENQAGKKYKLNDEIATLVIRPRGWHLDEKHLTLDGEPLSASLVDFGLFLSSQRPRTV